MVFKNQIQLGAVTLYRFYDPTSQRWINRDPIRERGGINIYSFDLNDPMATFDPYGLCNWREVGQGALTTIGGVGGIVLGAVTAETGVGLAAIFAGVPAFGLGLTTMAHGFSGGGPVNTPTGSIPQGPVETVGAMTGNPNMQTLGSIGDLAVSWNTPPDWGGKVAALNTVLNPPSAYDGVWPFNSPKYDPSTVPGIDDPTNPENPDNPDFYNCTDP